MAYIRPIVICFDKHDVLVNPIKIVNWAQQESQYVRMAKMTPNQNVKNFENFYLNLCDSLDEKVIDVVLEKGVRKSTGIQVLKQIITGRDLDGLVFRLFTGIAEYDRHIVKEGNLEPHGKVSVLPKPTQEA